MDWKHVLHAFNLEDQCVLDEQIKPIAAIKIHTLVFDGQRDLSCKINPAKMEFVAKTFFVSRLQKSGT